MIHETIDLYEYFNVPREGHEGGILTVYARALNVENTPKLRPGILVIPGGGYNMISAREGEPIAMRFLSEGFSAFVLQYTVKTTYPTPLVEAAMAMAYIRQNAEKYFVDIDHVCAVGFSAGGHLAGMLATIYADAHIKALLGEANVRPDAVLLAYAVSTTSTEITHGETAKTISGNHPALRAALSNDKNVTVESSPAFIWHTADDAVVPVENAFLIASAYQKAGVPFALHIFESGWHGLSTADIEVVNAPQDANESVQQWLPLAFEWLKRRGFCPRNA